MKEPKFGSLNPDGTGWDSLFSTNNYYHVWSPDCSKIISYGGHSTDYYGSQITELFIQTTDGQSIDSVTLPNIQRYVWRNADEIAVAYNHKFINIFNSHLVLFKKIRVIPDDFPHNRILGLDWIPNSRKVVWSTINGIYITDVDSEKTTVLVISDERDVYNSVSLSADGTQLITNVSHFNCNGSGITISYRLIDRNTGAVTELPLF